MKNSMCPIVQILFFKGRVIGYTPRPLVLLAHTNTLRGAASTAHAGIFIQIKK
jgi:hypothetical protein